MSFRLWSLSPNCLWGMASILISWYTRIITWNIIVRSGHKQSSKSHPAKLSKQASNHYLGPFFISYLEAQVTWNFSSKSLDRFLSSLQVTWKPSHLAKSQVTSVADLEISNIVICVLYLFKLIYVALYGMFSYTYVQKAVRTLFIGK